MEILSTSQISGDIVRMNSIYENHITDTKRSSAKGEKVASSFAEMFNKAIGEVNDLENKSTKLATQLAVDPESADIHDVQIAAEEAEMAVLFTKNIVDKAIRAYKEILNLR